MGKYKRLGGNTLYIFIGNASAKIIGLLMLPFYTSWLSVEDYGTTDIINVYVTFLTSIVSCCIAEAIFIFPKNQSINKQQEYFSTGLLFLFLSFCITAIIFYILHLFAVNIQDNNTFFDNLNLIYLLLISIITQLYFQQFARSIDKIKIYSLTGLILTISTALFSYYLIPTYGVSGYVLAISCAHISAALFAFIASKSYNYLSITKLKKNSCYEMLKYSIPMIPNGVMWWFVSALNRPIMENYLDMQSIGIYAVANKFPSILSMLSTIFMTAWQISAIEEFRKEGYNTFFNKIFQWSVLFLMCAFIFISLFSKTFIHLFTTNEYYEAWKYIPVLTLSSVFSSLSGIVGANFSAVKKSSYYFYSSIYAAIVSIITNFTLISLYGINGALISIILSLLTMCVSRIYYSNKFSKLNNIKLYLVTLIIGLIISFTTIYINNYQIIISIEIIGLISIIYLNKQLIVETFHIRNLFNENN